MRFNYDKAKSERLRKKRGVGFEEVRELFYGPYFCAEQNPRWYSMVERIPDGERAGHRGSR